MKECNPYLYFEREIFLEVLDDHNKEGKLNAEGLLGIGRARYIRRADIGANYLEHQTLDVVVRYPLYVPIANFFVPDLQRFAAYAVKN